jgi:sugar/nucleoside kinase (ribokinase family)
LTDVLILNDQELRLLTGVDNVIKALPEAVALGPKRVVVKKGEHGALMYNGSDFFMCPAVPITELVDPTGAGDTFAGGFFGYLAGRGMGELLDAELRGTIGSLRRRGRPVAEMRLDVVSGGALGELLLLLEAAAAFAGPLYGVDPYDQPGVEEAKRLAYAALGRPGYEALAAEMNAAPGSDPRYVM